MLWAKDYVDTFEAKQGWVYKDDYYPLKKDFSLIKQSTEYGAWYNNYCINIPHNTFKYLLKQNVIKFLKEDSAAYARILLSYK